MDIVDDVIVGSLVGGGIGYLIPRIHKMGSNLNLQASGHGLSLTYKIE